MSGSISAQFVEVATPQEMDGYRAFDLQVTTAEDWSFASLLIEPDQGSIYQDAAGTDMQPNPALFGSYPTLAYDSYIAANGHSLSVLESAREIGGDDLRFDTHVIDITWFDLAKTDTGTFTVARVTVTDNASGDLAMRMLNDAGGDFARWATFENGDLTDLTPAPQRDPTPAPPEPEPTVPVDNTVRLVRIDNAAALTGYKTYDVVVSTEHDWKIGAMLLELDRGRIYQDAMGTDTKPPELLFDDYPTLEFDSYVTTNGNPTAIVGHSAELGGSQLQFDESRIDIAWIDTQQDDVGVFSIARVTLSDNAAGRFKLRAYYGDYVHQESYSFSKGDLHTSTLPESPPPPPPAPMFVEFVEVKSNQSLSGYKTFDLLVTSETDWQNAALELDLTGGEIYQDPAGTHLAPNPVTFGHFATLEYDTYVTANGGMTSILGYGDQDTGRDEVFDSSSLDITWSGPAGNETGRLLLGRITVSDDAVGSLNLRVSSDNNETNEAGYFSFGNLNAFTSASTPAAAAAADFTNDGRADILWLNTQSGELNLWQMNRTSVVNKIGSLAGLGEDWCAIATGDLTGDGVAEVVWRNQRNGRNLVTELDGAQIISQTYIKRLRNRNWQVGGIGDFTGDGKADILWRHASNGRNAVWEMDGTTFVAAAAIKQLRNPRWIIAGTTDFDGDGETDILWRNTQSGRNVIWEMNSTALEQVNAIQTNSRKQWQIAGVGDYTGDGRADILWRHLSTGRNSVWQMDGTELGGIISLEGLSDAYWQPAGPLLGLWEDIDGDRINGVSM